MNMILKLYLFGIEIMTVDLIDAMDTDVVATHIARVGIDIGYIFLCFQKNSTQIILG